ncbi:MAG: spermidine/putrescine transport system permease protein [Actinomycetota bacterium]|nr:spermidine/putrescine transport system permease protein [Actinomycetota bacterium]
MAATTVPETQVAEPDLPPIRTHGRRRARSFILPTFTVLVIVYLIVPIAVMILYSFNQGTAATTAAAPKVSLIWQGFTLDWWRQWNGVPDLTAALWNSIIIAVTSTVVSAILGTGMALALVRYKFKGQGGLEMVMFLNIAAPEIVLGAGLLSLLVTLNFQRGLSTIFIAHVMFNVAFVAIVVRARLAGFSREVEEAAKDLYADAWGTFFYVTLPLIWPGIMAGALLAFALSIDDFIITNFVAGQTITFPLWVYGAVKTGIPPQVFVMGTSIFAVGVIIAVVQIFGGARKKRHAAAVTEDELA